MPFWKKGWVLKSGAFALIAGLTLIYRSSLCNLLFQCGCQSALAAGGKYCNIHMPNMAHCPWCSHGWWGHKIPTGSILLSQAAVVFVPSKLSITNRIVLSVVAFFVIGGVIGLLFGYFSGYPTFLGLRLP